MKQMIKISDSEVQYLSDITAQKVKLNNKCCEGGKFSLPNGILAKGVTA